ncbi:MAG: DNA-processing protein DprA [Acidobacteriota bacterium]
MKDNTFYSLALSLAPGLGTTRIHEMIRKCGSPSEVFRRSRSELKRFNLSHEIQLFLSSGRALRQAEETLQACGHRDIGVISFLDQAYPQLLKEIFDPPVILYCRGSMESIHNPGIAIVGARRCSVYGKQVTRKLALELSVMGLNIVSGLARGIDSQAHQGALEGGGVTIGVLGSGVDVVYPRENRRLYEQIQERGCVLSEFPCGSFPAPQNFPIRNRVISGLSYGTIISEASEFSGSLITARLTLEHNRELWAVPGNITTPGSYGPNYLIKQGAKIVLTAQDVMDELPIYVLDFLSRSRPSSPAPLPHGNGPLGSGPLSPPQEKVLKLLSSDASTHFDWLLGKSQISLSELNAVLLELELQGLVRQWPGRQFSKRL